MKVGQAGMNGLLDEVEQRRSNDDAVRLPRRSEPPFVHQERQRLDVPPALRNIGPRPADGQGSNQLPRPRGVRLLPPSASVWARLERGLQPQCQPLSPERRPSGASHKVTEFGADAGAAPTPAGVDRQLLTDRLTIQSPDACHPSGMVRGIDLLDADLPYKKRRKVREQWELLQETRGPALAGPPLRLQDAPAQRRAMSNVEKTLWHCGKQRREEFGDLLSKHHQVLSGPAFLREIRSLTDMARPLTNVLIPSERSDIQLFRIRVPGNDNDVYVLRRDAEDGLRDLRRLKQVSPLGELHKGELHEVVKQMEKSASQSYGRNAAARGKSIRHPHLSDLWAGGKRKQEFQALYSAYRRLPGNPDITGGSFLSELHQIMLRAEGQRGRVQDTGVAGIQLFNIQVPGTSAPVQVLRRLNLAGDLADIRLASPATLEEILDQMADSHALRRGALMGSSAPSRDQRLSVLWRRRLESRLGGALEDFRRAQPGRDSTDAATFIGHLDELCEESPGESVDDRFGITRHIVTPLGSTQPITLLRRKDDGELARMRVIDDNTTEAEALRSLRSVGPKRKPDAAFSEDPKRRKTQGQPNKLVKQLAGKATKDEAHLVGGPSGNSAHKGAVNLRLQSSPAGKPLHKVNVPQQHKEKTVDVTYLVTGAVGRMQGGLRTLEWAYANSPELIVPPRPYEGDRERQTLRWLCTALLSAFPGGKEVQACYDHKSDEIWISSNARGTNRKIRQFLSGGGLQGELQKQIQTQTHTGEASPNDRWARHPSRLHRALNDRSARYPDADPVLEAMAKRHFRVPSEIFHIDGVARQIDLHAERRIKRAFESATGTTIEPTKVVGTKRACGTCADDLQFSNTERRGPFWRSGAARAFVDMTSAVNACLEKGIPTYISRGRDGGLNLYVSDSDSDA